MTARVRSFRRTSSGDLQRGTWGVNFSGMNTNHHVLRSKSAALIAGLCFLLMPTLLLAHHASGDAVRHKNANLADGAVTKVDWSNPHVRLYLDVKDQGRMGNWELEMGSPNVQMMNGWKIDTYRPGDRVTVIAYPAKNGTMLAYGQQNTAARSRASASRPSKS